LIFICTTNKWTFIYFIVFYLSNFSSIIFQIECKNKDSLILSLVLLISFFKCLSPCNFNTDSHQFRYLVSRLKVILNYLSPKRFLFYVMKELFYQGIKPSNVFVISKSKMSAFCDADSQNCWLGCCNISGKCPSSSRNCSFYYTKNTTTSTSIAFSTMPIGTIMGIAFGVFGLFMIIALAIYWRRRQALMAAMVANSNVIDGQTTIIVPNQNSAVVQPVTYLTNNGGYAQPTPFSPQPMNAYSAYPTPMNPM
jgi:hypothetical protein